MNYVMRVFGVVALSLWASASFGQGKEFDWDPITLTGNNWICASPEAYVEALELERVTPRAELDQVKADLLERRACMFVDRDDAEDIMAPFVKILERSDDKARVEFTIEYYKKIEYLHRDIRRVTYAGWTGQDDLTSAFPLYSN